MPYNSVKDFLDHIGDKEIQKINNDEIDFRIELINQLHKIAISRIGVDVNWNIQYVVPLFLVLCKN